jgi:hypothetical protein
MRESFVETVVMVVESCCFWVEMWPREILIECVQVEGVFVAAVAAVVVVVIAVGGLGGGVEEVGQSRDSSSLVARESVSRVRAQMLPYVLVRRKYT